jgi:HTH-type transcriptional regulator/antitoxin HigA
MSTTTALPMIRPIRSEADYDRAVKLMDKLVLRDDLSRDEADYLEVLTFVVERYDDEHYPLAADTRTPLQRLRALMESSGMTPAGFGDVIGSRPAASMILSGSRELSKTHIRRLAKHFKLNPGYFF